MDAIVQLRGNNDAIWLAGALEAYSAALWISKGPNVRVLPTNSVSESFLKFNVMPFGFFDDVVASQ
jgi:hypothetical protein